MRKIPTLFLRDDPNDPHHVTSHVNPAAEWVFTTTSPGDMVATRKYDGTCVMLDDNGHWWARREVKPGKPAPAHFRMADHDEVTGKVMGWVPLVPGWNFFAMFRDAIEHAGNVLLPGTYELCGPKIQGNPEGFKQHYLVRHATAERIEYLDGRLPLSYSSLRTILTADVFTWEGIVWHHQDGRRAKLKRKDFR